LKGSDSNMATSNNSLRVADLDFASIKTNLKNFLKSQNTFQDYDFEGSGMSVLLDILAYNTYYNSFYLNMIANEAFLDTAQDRKNILSHAKLINYVPSSMHGAEAVVNIKVTPSATENQGTNYIVLDKYTRLLGADVSGKNYPFTTINANTAYKSNGSFAFSNVYIKQGEVVSHQFAVDANNVSRRYQIPSSNVDTDTLIVTVRESSSNNQTTQYFLAEDLTEIRANSTVFFLEEDQDLNYTIYFGDGVLGQKPANDNIIIMTYIDTLGPIANGIQKFSFTDPVAGLFRDNVKITSLSGTYGGTAKEDIEAIRFRAPFHYTAQNRAVTVNDYEALITKDYNNIEAVSVWGGEDNDPPVYGKVYISLKTRGYYALTDLEKQNIKNNLIKNRNVITVVPEIIDPEYVFIQVSGSVNYNPSLTTKTENDLLNLIKDAIYQYAQDELYTFQSTFKLSKLQQYIESSDPAITASDITIYMQNRKELTPSSISTYVINFNTPIRKGDLFQKLYTYPQVTVPDSTGVYRQVFFEEVPESYTGIDTIAVVNPGINYTSTPVITITGDGTGATAEAVVVNGRVRSVNVTNPGINYTRASVSITDTFGSEATFTAKLRSDYATIRSFYYESNGQKVFVNSKAGTVNYMTGQIVIDSLNLINVTLNPFYNENILTFNAVPENTVIAPLRNRLLAIDTNNAQSIQLKMVPAV
jgi:hypothetical protein